MELLEGGQPVGFDVDLARELVRRLGVTAEFIVMDWDGILAGLTSGRYDIILSSMNRAVGARPAVGAAAGGARRGAEGDRSGDRLRRDRRHHRAERLRQVHAAALPQLPGGPTQGRIWLRGELLGRQEKHGRLVPRPEAEVDRQLVLEQGPSSVIFSQPSQPRTREFLRKVLHVRAG